MSKHISRRPRSFSSIVSGVVLDIPYWMRGLLIVVGCCAVVVVIVASLTGNQEQTVEVDKLLHFGGYTTLAVIFVVGLRPAYSVPALVLLGLLGFAIEYLQPLNSRTRDMSDGVANVVGLATGAVVGTLLRLLIRAMRTGAMQLRLRRQRRTYTSGATILREGAKVSKLYVIERGEVRLSRNVDGRPQVVGTLGPGDVFGLLGALQGKPQFTTVEAVGDVSAYGMDVDDLFEAAPGNHEPMAAVLNVLSKYVRALADRLVEADKMIQ